MYRAEVGLISHNVIFQGSVKESNPFLGLGADQYGAQLFVHRTGPHPTPIRYRIYFLLLYSKLVWLLGLSILKFALWARHSVSVAMPCTFISVAV